MFVYRWTQKLFLEPRIWECMCVLWCHTGIHSSFVFVCTALFTYPWQVCCSPACVYALCWSLIKFPIEGFIIFSRQKRENYKPINPRVWSGSPLLPLCLLPSLFYVSRLLFTRFSSGPPCLWCWEVICLYVRAVPSPASPVCLLRNLSASSSSSKICECLRFGGLVFLVFVFCFSLFIRGIYIHVCLYLSLSDYIHLLWLFCEYYSLFSILKKVPRWADE